MKLAKNMGNTDRIIRLIVAAVFAVLYFTGIVSGTFGIVLLVLALGSLAAWGILESATVAAAATVIEIAGLVLIVAVSHESYATLPQRLPDLLPPFVHAFHRV